MASPAQISANQLNAQLSTGPTSETGKAAVAQNARTHGLSSAFTVLAHEDQSEFDVFLHVLREEHKPADMHQSLLVDQMAKAQWQLARAERLETVAFDLMAMPAPDSTDPDACIVNHILTAGRDALGMFKRYAAQAERSYYKAYRELAAAKQIRAEADFVKRMDGVTKRVITAPTPDHPAYGSPYGQPAKPPIQNKPNPSPASKSAAPLAPAEKP